VLPNPSAVRLRIGRQGTLAITGKSAYMRSMLSAPAKISLAPFSAVVFDMDGTLLDTESVFRDVVFAVCGTLGFPMTDDVHLAMVGSSHEATNRLLVEAYGVSFPYVLFEEQCREMFGHRMAEAVPLKEGVIEILGELRGRGIPAAVATSSRSAHALGHLGRAGLLELFETVVTRDDVENPKPHPEPYLTAAKRLGMTPRHCLAVEDSHSGVRAAHAAGMQTIMVPDLVHPSTEIEALCAAVMRSLHEVRAAFG
jgi:HAD superfamily hydrolase (TIGR01509 family)